MNDTTSRFPRIVRPAPEPLGLYLRASYNDHRALMDGIASSGLGFHGVVFDPMNEDRHSELRDLVLGRRRDAILDPRTQELGTLGGYKPKMSSLDWATDRPHKPEDFGETGARRIADAIAKYVVEHRYSAVLAPTHYVESANSPWLDIDARTTRYLRTYLDRNGAQNIPIFYSLAVSYKAFRTVEERAVIRDKVQSVPVNAIWLKVALSGNVTHASVQNFVNGAADFHSPGVPLVGDMMGGLRGLSALAFGATGGIAHGLTQKENFNASSWVSSSQQSGDGFSLPPRIYIPSLDIHLKREEAKAFFAARNAKSRFGCHDENCCAKGPRDTVNYPARHFLIQRSNEVQRLSAVPEQLRANRFLEETLRPATDAALFAEKLDIKDAPELVKRLETKRKTLELLRIGLGGFVKEGHFTSFSEIPQRRAARG